MISNNSVMWISLLSFLSVALPQAHSAGNTISFHEFYSDNPEVSVSADGFSTRISESAVITPIGLINDPEAGDTLVFGPGLRFVSFGYQFNSTPASSDLFAVVLFDSDLGPYFGELDSREISMTGGGTIIFDLEAWSGRSFGLLFELVELDRAGGSLESTIFLSNLRQDDSALTDSDGDGLPDDYETANLLNPLIDDSGLDADDDGLSNLQEYLIGTDPNHRDTDRDGMTDAYEVANNLDPHTANECPIEICPPSGNILKIIQILKARGELP